MPGTFLFAPMRIEDDEDEDTETQQGEAHQNRRILAGFPHRFD
jgi:hypothetical protein